MYKQENFTASISTGTLMDAVTGGSLFFTLQVSNQDTQSTLYNYSLSLTLPDGMELVSSSVPHSTVSRNTYNLVNIKDLAPGELNYEVNFEIKLNDTYQNGDVIPFGTLLSFQLTATADTMPRGNYDFENEILQSTTTASVNVSQYVVTKINPSQVLLGNEYTSTITIQTAVNAGVTFSEITDLLGNGMKFLGHLTFSGYTSEQLSSYKIIEPTVLQNSYQIIWGNVSIPENTVLKIIYKVTANEKYYMNGTASGSYIKNGDVAANILSWNVGGTSRAAEYIFNLFEVLLDLKLSDNVVDINDSVLYTINFHCNVYHSLVNLSGYLQTSDGQIMEDTPSLMYTSKVVSSGGITQLTWNVGFISKGTIAKITVVGLIAATYVQNGRPILSGDKFISTASCNAISAVTNQLMNVSCTASAHIAIPSVLKTITGYYYSDLTPKNYNILAPGDYVGYQMSYNGSEINAGCKSVKIFDFYPYIIKDILNISYDYSSKQYPATSIVPVDPYGVLWYVNSIAGNEKFTISTKAQVISADASSNYPDNLFKLQITNSEGISYSQRDQVGFIIGEPSFKISKTVTGNHPDRVEIGDVYKVATVLLNDNSGGTATDGFSFNLTETIPDGAILDSASVTVTIDGSPQPYTLQDDSITLAIQKLGPNSNLSLDYVVSIDGTLEPNQNFSFETNTTVPYTQTYNPNGTNIRYQVQPASQNVTISSAPISLMVSSDAPMKQVGENVEYTLNITFPAGQKLTSFYGLILIPENQEYLNIAKENGTPISAIFVGGRVIFPTVSGIDTTGGALSFTYQISCTINDCPVSVNNPLNTVKFVYGNLNYVTMLNSIQNMGINTALTIEHPYIKLGIGASAVMSGFKQMFMVGSNSIIYTNATASNVGIVDSENVNINILIPNLIEFKGIKSLAKGMTYHYNPANRTLVLNIDKISAGSSKNIIFRSAIQSGIIAESKLITTGTVVGYNNSITANKMYTTQIILNNELYINSLLSFLPTWPYQLTGSSAAINLSALGEATEIAFDLTNIGVGVDGYQITMTPILYPYDVYINQTFVKSVVAGSPCYILSDLLSSVKAAATVSIALAYTIPLDAPPPGYQTMQITARSVKNAAIFKVVPAALQDP